MKTRIVASVLLATVAVLAGSCGHALPAEGGDGVAAPEGAGCTPTGRVARDVPYGPAPLQRIDVYPAPAGACGENPVVLWVHGGGWRVGDKARLGAKRAWAREHGWTLVSVNYRLTDTDVAPARRIRYPTHNRDVGRAVDWVADHIAGYGGDPGRIALVGHSAGAQIVSSVGVDERYLRADVRPSLCGVVSLDTEGYDVAAVIAGGGRGALLYRAVFGNRPATWADASPVNHLDGSDPAQLVVVRGTSHRRLTQAGYAAALRAAGIPGTVVATPGYSHGDVNRRLGEPGESVLTPAVEAFLADCFAT